MTMRKIIFEHALSWLAATVVSEVVLIVMLLRFESSEPLSLWELSVIPLLSVSCWCLELVLKKVYHYSGQLMQFIFPVPWRHREFKCRHASVSFDRSSREWKTQLMLRRFQKYTLYISSYRKALRVGKHWVTTGNVLSCE